MKRLLSLFLVCLLLLAGCATGPEPVLSDMLGTQTENAYTSPFGFSIDTSGMYVFAPEDLASVNILEEFTAEALMTRISEGSAVTVFAATPGEDASISLSLFPAAELPKGIETAADYAEYGLSMMSEKFKDAGYTDCRTQLVDIKLEDGTHPALLCSASMAEGSPYHLLQICFREGDWLGSLSMSSTESEEALRELLILVTPTN